MFCQSFLVDRLVRDQVFLLASRQVSFFDRYLGLFLARYIGFSFLFSIFFVSLFHFFSLAFPFFSFRAQERAYFKS
jgi:hypothetical protein